MHLEAGMFLQPLFDLGVFVGLVVVQDQIQIQTFWSLSVCLPQEGEPLLMAVARHARANHLAIGIAFVDYVGLDLSLPLLHAHCDQCKIDDTWKLMKPRAGWHSSPL